MGRDRQGRKLSQWGMLASESPLEPLMLSLFALAEDELEPARKKRREQLAYLESEEFQKILKAKSRHTGIIKEVGAQKIKDGRGGLWLAGQCHGTKSLFLLPQVRQSNMLVCLSLF